MKTQTSAVSFDRPVQFLPQHNTYLRRAVCGLAVCAAGVAGAATPVPGNEHRPAGAPGSPVLFWTAPAVPTAMAGAASEGILVTLLLPVSPGPTVTKDDEPGVSSIQSWPRVGVAVLTAFPRTAGDSAQEPQATLLEAPFPTGLGMGLVGLALVLGSNMVRRFRLNIV